MATLLTILNKQIGNITYSLLTCHTIILKEIISPRFRKDDGSSKGASLTNFFLPLGYLILLPDLVSLRTNWFT